MSDSPPELPSPPEEAPHSLDSPDDEFVEADAGGDDDNTRVNQEAVAVAQ